MPDNTSWDKRTTSETICSSLSTNIQDRNILLTGPTITGIGFAVCKALIQYEPKVLILAGRSQSKLEEAKDDLLKIGSKTEIRLLVVDFSDLESVKKAGQEVLNWGIHIDVLINNAAVMDTPYTLTAQNHELQFATNYLAPFILTLTLLPLILKSTNKTIVNVSSSGHGNGMVRWDDPAFRGEKGYNKKEAYGQSKTALILFTRELARRYGDKGLRAFSMDPGGISTPLQQHWSLEEKQDIGEKYGAYHQDGSVNTDCEIWKTPSQGGATECRAAFDTKLQPNGSYLVDCQINEDACRDYAKDMGNAEKLWGWTNELIGESF